MNAASSPPAATAVTPSSTSSPSLARLPAELLSQIFGHLPAWALARVGQTCRRLHSIAADDLLWSRQEAAQATGTHAPFGSWREMYGVHAPYWFLLQQRVWFADRLTGHQELIGQLALAHYDDRMGTVTVTRLRAALPIQRILMRWGYDTRVVIFSFHPRVALQADDPVLCLEPGQYGPGPRLKQEVALPAVSDRLRRGMRCRLMLTRAIPPRAQVPENGLWPPSIVPHAARVRCQSPSKFYDSGHKPDRHDQVCETAFRTRMWSHFHNLDGALGIRIGEEVSTWSSLPRDAYIPSEEKPFQGVWVGDYAMHGPEFILITQKTPAEVDAHPPPRIEEMSDAVRDEIGLARLDHRGLIPWTAEAAAAGLAGLAVAQPAAAGTGTGAHLSSASTSSALGSAAADGAAYSSSAAPHLPPRNVAGRLEAIKLTGDTHVPRGQYTFVAEDIGPTGLLRVAQEPPFQGARVVRSWAHVATRGFLVDGWMHGHLILKSRNRLAQYWLETGHVVWYRRVDWEGLLAGVERRDSRSEDAGRADENKRSDDDGASRKRNEEGNGNAEANDEPTNHDRDRVPNGHTTPYGGLARAGIIWDPDEESPDSDEELE